MGSNSVRIDHVADPPKGWTPGTISDVADVNPGFSLAANDEWLVTFIAMTNLGNGTFDSTNVRPFGSVRNGFTQFQDNDVLVAKITPCFENGKGALVRNLTNGIGAGSTEFVVLRSKTSVVPEFLFYCTMLPEFRRRGADNMVGSAGQQRLQVNFIKSYPLLIPPLAEQKAIAAVLSTWDRAIEQTTALIAAKERLKQGLMQQLLSGKRRFPEFRKQQRPPTRLGDVLTKVAKSVVVGPQQFYREIGIRSHGKGIFHKEPVAGVALGDKRVYEVVPGCLTLNIVFAWERALAVTSTAEAGMIASHRFPMFRPDKERVEIEYVLHYMLSDVGCNVLELASPGGAGRNRTISQEQFLRTTIPLPPVEEQRKIVAVNHVSECELRSLRGFVAALKRQKRGLMQQLLTGQVRVPAGLIRQKGAKP